MRRKSHSDDSPSLPSKLELELATLVQKPPRGEGWVQEIKWDGYRSLARLDEGDARLISRRGIDWTAKAPGVVAALEALALNGTAIDGELCALEPGGRSSFGLLQRSLGTRSLTYVAFDLLFLRGRDLRALPLLERKQKLVALLGGLAATVPVRVSEHFVESGVEVFEHACKLKLEGIIAKKVNSPYRGGRHPDWLKIKCTLRQEFAIVGYRVDDGLHNQIRSLLLGIRDGEVFRYAGKVGTGFSGKQLRELYVLLSPIAVPRAQVMGAPRGAEVRDVRWVEPRFCAEITFTEFTRDGTLRHPVFQGLRSRRPAGEPDLDTARTALPKKPRRRPSE